MWLPTARGASSLLLRLQLHGNARTRLALVSCLHTPLGISFSELLCVHGFFSRMEQSARTNRRLFLKAKFLLVVVGLLPIVPAQHMALRQTVQCTCGAVKLGIDSPSVLRFVTYGKDCRGFFNALNEAASSNKKTEAALLDEWGGVDWTQLYPSEISVDQGEESLAVCLIRPGSNIRRVYSTCCYTPMFSVGKMAALLNTHLVDDKNKPEVRFRIMGRQAFAEPAKTCNTKRPPISWSVPLGWFWVMPQRIKKDRMTPEPLDLSNPQVLENFKEG